MNRYENNNERTNIRGALSERQEEDYYFDLVNAYQPVFLELEGIARVLGAEHPLTKLMDNAVETLDTEELEIALAAYEALPDHIQHRILFPWIGSPPPAGTREKLRQTVAPELVGESMGTEPVGCYLQIDARKGSRNERHWRADNDGHVVDPALVYDLRVHKDWPVRVQIAEGSDKELVLDLLKKISGRVERDWDQLTNPDLSLKLPEDPSDPFGW